MSRSTISIRDSREVTALPRAPLLGLQRLVEHPRQPHSGLVEPLLHDRQIPLLVSISQLGARLDPLTGRRVLVGRTGGQQ
jgi:hypothetical protein